MGFQLLYFYSFKFYLIVKLIKKRYFKTISLCNPPLKPLRAHCRNCRLTNAKLFYILITENAF
ncbi:hypothetical protein BB480_03175 [Helicobacter pylori]|nr:hypothetical protein BB480_03175 [Helicobacter pylori]